MPQPVALGIVGAGIMGERMLGAVLDGAPGPVRIAGVWDPSPGAMDRIAARFPAVERHLDAASVIGSSECLYIASPPASHLGYARAALQAGKTAFVEKPLAVDLDEARAFVKAAGNQGTVNFPFASSLGVASLRDWMAQGEVGRPLGVRIEVAFRAWPRPWQADAAGWLDGRAEGGFTREVVSHFLFLCRRLVGPLTGLKARADFPEDGRSERWIEATFSAGNIPVTLVGTVGQTTRDDHNSWTLEGEAGAVRLCDWAIAERRLPGGEFQPAPDAVSNEQASPTIWRPCRRRSTSRRSSRPF